MLYRNISILKIITDIILLCIFIKNEKIQEVYLEYADNWIRYLCLHIIILLSVLTIFQSILFIKL